GIDLIVVDLTRRLPGRKHAPAALADRRRAHRAGVEVPRGDVGPPEAACPVFRGQKVHVAVDEFSRGSVKNVEVALIVGKGLHSAAATGARGLPVGRRFAREGLAFVPRSRHPYATVGFAVLSGVAVPRHVYVTRLVGGHGAASVKPYGELHDIALGLESGLRVVQPRVEHGRRAAGTSGLGLGGTQPSDVDAPG